MSNLTDILKHISILKSKYEEIDKISGSNFNIFKIIEVESDEVRLHSAFIAELLNPKGSHGLGDTLLKLFLSQVKIQIPFDIQSAKVEIEKYIGKTTDFEGGRLDIAIYDRNRSYIIIENKIYAGDQNKQLLRYFNFKCYQKQLFYLTLNGNEPDESSKVNLELNKDYFLLSYKTDISLWLKLCKKEAVNHPLLRETIEQYLNLIKYLTGQNMNEKMNNEITDLILSSNTNLEQAVILEKTMNNIKAKVQLLFWADLEENLKSHLKDKSFKFSSDYTQKVESYYADKSRKYKYYGIQLEIMQLSSSEKLIFFIEVDNNIYYGFRMVKNEKIISNSDLTYKKFIDLANDIFPNARNNEQSFCWCYPVNKINFNDFTSDNDIIFKLAESKSRSEVINNLVIEIVDFINKFWNEIKS